MAEHSNSTPRRIVIAGGHGKIARHLTKLLTARGDRAVALIRNPDHEHAVAALGAEPVVIDLENSTVDDVAKVLLGADAAVFAAGAGPGSGAERKDTVDRGGAVLLAEAAEKAGVRRFVQVSSFGAGEPIPEGTDDVFAAYLVAKTSAEEDLRARTYLDWTILRPGGLTDDEPTGHVTLAAPPLERGTVPRADVAAVVVALLDDPTTARKTLMLTSGPTPVEDAVAAL
ncbi:MULTISPECIES: NAD(P)H-binding protein [Rhodococcus]|uniref:NAD(P)H-binding protein n=1 Tax=Rhodococcus oxybenzonivorans TaxID=1990687 RepID=A0AAE4UW20_9NOCA|nr:MULTISPECIES: NAD(P)H-binding protein [Rhodococcus]MDV7243956.1 NAD(P)H-binding protein [Rhodococcus oxybenzonivorans]MDV7263785.1 NAD(P)H-binding protein [Rhodococcus oxybenzonivorans]MDV7274802.1 NAD(P)H-binding protein [Rhodococcus oxybenzonivorans]MDV7335041.1 NAD(P)H-binding protein [Rhodococcus oxybenzonivorans]MDV7345752.1 NAD(P)H-binding protein [Rhodococcus oxybenzonivorans]